jgi:hypothetical protein
MVRDIVVFEIFDREKDEAELDFRLIRQALPVGACPLAIADNINFYAHCGQHFTSEEVELFARQHSGYTKLCEDDKPFEVSERTIKVTENNFHEVETPGRKVGDVIKIISFSDGSEIEYMVVKRRLHIYCMILIEF